MAWSSIKRPIIHKRCSGQWHLQRNICQVTSRVRDSTLPNPSQSQCPCSSMGSDQKSRSRMFLLERVFGALPIDRLPRSHSLHESPLTAAECMLRASRHKPQWTSEMRLLSATWRWNAMQRGTNLISDVPSADWCETLMLQSRP